jgi:hypothetical protein
MELNRAYVIAQALLEGYTREMVNSEIIKSTIDNILLMRGFEHLNIQELQLQLESDFGINDYSATQLTGVDVQPWVYKTDIDYKFWERYVSFLRVRKASFPVSGLSDKTTQILDNCRNPIDEGQWDRRGMVVGNVQSGKTANYTGLINKAMDAGYKMIIVMAGVHNTLRAQTQDRIDEGVIGRKSADLIQKRPTNKYGVGFYSVPGTRSVYAYTSTPYLVREGGKAMRQGDFDINKARELNVPIDGSDPTVLVIKKNKTILENLVLWLEQSCNGTINGFRKITNVPVLIIDDEADNASVNSGDMYDVRAINKLIRVLLSLFAKNTYIGYTATPYANIFIPSDWDREGRTEINGVPFLIGPDLFPKDFIVNIHPPSNYIGAAQVFGFENPLTGDKLEPLKLIRLVDDQAPCFPKTLNKDNRENRPEGISDLPTSFTTAVKSFIIACAIKRHRGLTKDHNSMLVHVALYVEWIDRVAYIVNELVHDYRNQIRSGQGPLLSDLRELFEDDFKPTTHQILDNLTYKDPKIKTCEWEEVMPHLQEVMKRMEVRAIHGSKKNIEYQNIKELNYDQYDDGLTVIAVGGNKLARGITLEGLSVSYYLRTARMYDTLMQMGRWFGYRPGYVDLCRLYTTEQIRLWYRHVAMATEDMRSDFDELVSLGMRPDQYRLKVMSHPGMLSITAASKMKGHQKLAVGYSGKLIQTYSFSTAQEYMNRNLLSFTSLLSQLSNPVVGTNSGRINELLWKGVSHTLIADFLSGYKTDQPLRIDTLCGYIDLQSKKGKLKNWDIAVISNSSKVVRINEVDQPVKQLAIQTKEESYDIGCPVRTLENLTTHVEVGGRKNAILDKRARMIGLTIHKSEGKPISEDDIKKARADIEQPLLVLYPLDPRVININTPNIPIIGWGLVFPKLEGEEAFEYALRPDEECQNEPHTDNDPDDGE